MNQDEQRQALRDGLPTRSVWDRLNETTERLVCALRELQPLMDEVFGGPRPAAPTRIPISQQDAVRAALAARDWLKPREIFNSRMRHAVEMRYLCWLAMQLSGHTYSEIGRLWGGRDHTTVIYGCRRAVERLAAGELEHEWLRLLEHLGRTDYAGLWRYFLPEEQQAAGQEDPDA